MADKVKTILPDQALLGWDKDFKTGHFLYTVNSFLKDYVCDGFLAANLINSWAYKWNINQRLALITLEKEQGLLDKKTIEAANIIYKQLPSAESGKMINITHLNAACGAGVWVDKVWDKCLGFNNQIEAGCKAYRKEYETFKPGVELKLVDNITVIPETAITYAFLRYTPNIKVLKSYENFYLQYFPDYVKSIT